MKILEMELALAKHFNYRMHTVITNVSWGFNIHECDVLVLSASGYLTEIEIKTSKADLIKDKEKKHQHISSKIKALYFAIPEGNREWIEHIPERAGVIEVVSRYRCRVVRKPVLNKVDPLPEHEQQKLLRLAYLRTWTLKRNICDLIQIGAARK